jgi:hypothetical protein
MILNLEQPIRDLERGTSRLSCAFVVTNRGFVITNEPFLTSNVSFLTSNGCRFGGLGPPEALKTVAPH